MVQEAKIPPPIPGKPQGLRAKGITTSTESVKSNKGSIDDNYDLSSPSSSLSPLPPPLPSRPPSIDTLANLKLDEGKRTIVSNKLDFVTFNSTKAYPYGPKFASNLNTARSGKTISGVVCVSHYILAFGSGSINKWDIWSGECVWTRPTGLEMPLNLTVIDGKTFAFGTQTGKVILADVTTGTLLKTINVSSKRIEHLAVNAEQLYAIDEVGWLNSWNISKGLVNADSKESLVRILPNAQFVKVTSSGYIWACVNKVIEVHSKGVNGLDNLIARFDFELDLNITNIGNITALCSNVTGPSAVYTGHEDGSLILWEPSECVPLKAFRVGYNKITALTAFDDFLWIGMSTGRIQVIHIPTLEIFHDFKVHQTFILTLSPTIYGKDPLVSPMVSVCSSGGIFVWDGLVKERLIDGLLHEQLDKFTNTMPLTVRVCSWNADSQKPPADSKFWSAWQSDKDCDVIVLGIQEMINLESKSANAKIFLSSKSGSLTDAIDNNPALSQLWVDEALKNLSDDYVLLIQKNMVGLMLAIFVRTTIVDRIHHVSVDAVRNGLNGLYGNKGSIAARLIIDDSSFCFINCHLAAGQSQVDARNADVQNILKSTKFPRLVLLDDHLIFLGGEGCLVDNHETVVLFGDLNYRLATSREQAEQIIETNQDWKTLLQSDQLCQQKGLTTNNNPLASFTEGIINFAPTYKYDRGTDRLDSSEKCRVPAYCDRILLRSTPASKSTITEYTSHPEMKTSDHRPISATIKTTSKCIDPIEKERLRLALMGDWLTQRTRINNIR